MSRRDDERAGTGAREDRERGAALLTVMIFGVGILTTVGFLLSVTRSNQSTQRSSQRRAALYGVARAGLAESIVGIRRSLNAGPIEASAGVGAQLGAGGEGVEVRDHAGRLLGRYRVTVATRGAEQVLTAVAAFPDFAAPRELVALESSVVVDASTSGSLFGDRNPLSILGPAGTFSVDLMSNPGNPVVASDPSGTVAAVNVSDSDFLAELQNAWDALVGSIHSHEGELSFLGADPENPGGMASGMGSVTNNSPGAINEEMLDAVHERISDHVDGLLAGGASELGGALASLPGATVNGSTLLGGDLELPEGTYYVENFNLQNGAKLKGSGTLIVKQKLKLLGSDLEWDGDVIVIGEHATVELQHSNADLRVKGTLAFTQRQGSQAELQLLSGADVHVDGALVMLNDEQSEIEMHNHTDLNVRGILAIFAEKHQVWGHDSADLNVDGSLAFVVPSDATGGEMKWEFRQGAEMTLTMDDEAFEAGLAILSAFAGGAFNELEPSQQSLSETARWEVVGSAARAAQQAQIDAGQALGIEVE